MNLNEKSMNSLSQMMQSNAREVAANAKQKALEVDVPMLIQYTVIPCCFLRK